MESLGAAIVLNGLEGGEMTQPAEFSLRELDSDPMAVLADAYFGAIPSVFSRPNSALYQWLRRELPSSGAKGVVLLRYVWCDLWHAEVARLREWLKVPLLDIDLVGRDAPERSRTRLEAFLEGISKC
jgi:benzoyl-CoA reductase/2-hydroxyglutaryl-CoA dehydratase subunit BcrC/BadD/HgdB